MRIIAKSTLKNYWEQNPDCKQALLSWYKVARQSRWQKVSEIKNHFGTCKNIGKDRIIFKIKGNKYRLIVKITFTNQIIWIGFIGTHSEYDSINAKEI
ncbi:type II toxin-antitoxin system HigB family toxin [Saprospiraceae bacterium]|nr:type II toxin-antitoxin system HigB family toxin [Saprospiraceae bacterium]